ncbi:MAG: hypothetical protein WC728_19040 [Elusimicrobiota bacterium]
MVDANQDTGNQFYFLAQQTKTKMTYLQTSDQHKTSEPPPKHWNNFADDFTTKLEKNKPTLPTKPRIINKPKPEEQNRNNKPTMLPTLTPNYFL